MLFDINCIKQDTKYIYYTPLISPTSTDKNIIVYQLKPFKQYIYCTNEQLDGINNTYDNNNVFSITSRSNENDNKGYICINDNLYTNYFFDNEHPSSEKNSAYNNQWN